ncbi:YoaK family protein [Spirillospora sp. NPDC049652]
MKGEAEEGESGPLPLLLIGLTLVTGLVDSVCYLALGNVFVANMTGNVIFLGLGLAGSTAVSAPRSLLAIASFGVGAVAGGRLGHGRSPHRGLVLAAATVCEAALTVTVAVLMTVHPVPGVRLRLVLIALLGLGMGAQNAVVLRVNAIDLKTTVVTSTLTSLFAQVLNPRRRGRRTASVLVLLLGALSGGLLLRNVSPATPLWTASALMLLCAVYSYAATRLPDADRWA